MFNPNQNKIARVFKSGCKWALENEIKSLLLDIKEGAKNITHIRVFALYHLLAFGKERVRFRTIERRLTRYDNRDHALDYFDHLEKKNNDAEATEMRKPIPKRVLRFLAYSANTTDSIVLLSAVLFQLRNREYQFRIKQRDLAIAFNLHYNSINNSIKKLTKFYLIVRSSELNHPNIIQYYGLLFQWFQ